MVQSKLNSDVVYKENTNIDDEDIGYAATLYEYTMFGISLVIALGKIKYTYSKYDVVYYPIYLIVNEEPVAKIGIFEIDSNRVIDIIDEDGDIDLLKGNIIIYTSEKHLRDLTKEQLVVNSEPDNIINLSSDTTSNELKKDVEKDVVDEEEDDVTRIQIPKRGVDAPAALVTDQSIFIQSAASIQLPPVLPEESEVDSTQSKHEYIASSKNNWMQKFTKNNHYSIIDNEGGGHCFFAVIRDAFHQLGKETTVEKLRALLVPEVTDDLFRHTRTLYLSAFAEYQEQNQELSNIKKLITILKQRIERTTNKIEHNILIEEAKVLADKHKSIKMQKDHAKILLDDYDYVKDIDSLDKYKEYVLTARCWADDWAIETIERILNIKVIILSEEAYDEGDLDSIMKCGIINEDELALTGRAKPEFYIMTAHTGNHYKLIAYKDKRILNFTEIPYDVKMLVINKCMERNAGPYALIKDFTDLKNRLGVVITDSAGEDESFDKDTYDKDVVFMFYKDSNHKPKPGFGSNEKIPVSQQSVYTKLNAIKDWRKMLDDSWSAPFTIEGHRFNSIEHYVLGSQYKKGFPDFFLQFALDSNSDISKDVETARAAGGKTGKHKDIVLRNKTIKTDPDYYEVGVNPRYLQERNSALTAKFSQNLDLKQVLLETHKAKLIHFSRGKEPETDELLMKLRKDLSTK